MNKVIWIVNEYNLPGVSRTRQTVLSQRLEERGYEVYLICGSMVHKTAETILNKDEQFRLVESDGAKYYVIRTSEYHRSYERILVGLQFQHRIWKLRDKLPKPDVIVSDFAGLFGNVFLKWKKKYGTKVIYDILDLWPEAFVDMGYIKGDSLVAKVLYAMEHKSYREADGTIFSFQGGKDYIVDKGWSKETGGDVDTSDIGYLNNGVDLETVDVQKAEYVYDDEDLDSKDFKAVYLGSVSEFNGLDILVDVAERLNAENINNIRILVYGYGNQEERLKALVREKQLNNIVFKGKIDKEYAMNVLSRGDINIFTFKDTELLKYGTSPNKLFMYFASGKPVLSLIQPAYDLVTSENAGISVPNKVDAIVEALLRFRDMGPEEYQNYCKNSRAVAEKYDYKILVNELIRFIESDK